MSHKRHKTHDNREEKRAHFSDGSHGSDRSAATLAGRLVLIVVALAVLYALFTARKTTRASGGDFSLPLAEVGSEARFYNYVLADGTDVGFFVIKSSDGVVRAALNTCDVCYRARKGYRQEGDDMVCKKCNQRFPSSRINEVQGGCNPVPLERSVEGNRLVIRANAFQQGMQYF